MLTSVKVLLSSIVDYAGLFPPAQLSLQEAMANYACVYPKGGTASHRATPNCWMLGAFVVSAARLNEFAELVAAFPLQSWPLSVIVCNREQAETVIEKGHSLNSTIALQALEFPPLPPAEIETVLPGLPEGIDAFFEIPLSHDPTPYLAVLQGTGAAAKIRTGGLTVDAFPDVRQLCQFVTACAQANVPFKATAGLHHPLPACRPINQPDGPSAAMHGFLNLAVLSALIYWQKVTSEEAPEILKETNIEEFQFRDGELSWRDCSLTLSQLETTRRQCFRSFGSCSFEEPIADLQQLGVIDRNNGLTVK